MNAFKNSYKKRGKGINEKEKRNFKINNKKKIKIKKLAGA
jgi:hypothetical protein